MSVYSQLTTTPMLVLFLSPKSWVVDQVGSPDLPHNNSEGKQLFAMLFRYTCCTSDDALPAIEVFAFVTLRPIPIQ